MSTLNQNPNQPTIRPTSLRQGRKQFREEVPTKPRSMEAIHHGWEALEALYRYRAMESKHMAQLLFLGRPDPNGTIRDVKAAQQAVNRNCLRPLKNKHYVMVIDGENRKGNRLMPREMNVLTPLGLEALNRYRKRHGLASHPTPKDPASVIFQDSFTHWYGIMEIGVSAESAATLMGGSVKEFWDDEEIRRRSKLRVNPIRWGGIEPDAMIIMERNGESHAFMIEHDRGFQAVASDAPNSIRTKAVNYRNFFLRYRPQDPLLGPLRQPTVHFVTNSEERLGNIRGEIERLGGRQAYWYSTTEWTRLPYSFLGTVWQVSGREHYHSPMSLFQP